MDASKIDELDVSIFLSEETLKRLGFRWEQHDRQPSKHWVLWIGGLLDRMFSGPEDLGIEVAFNESSDDWFCWLRSDAAHRYHRFIHIRHIKYEHELVDLISALSGVKFDAQNVVYGCLRTEEHAMALKAEQDRLDLRILANSHPWTDFEKDPHRAKPSVMTAEDAIKGGLSK